ncbi:amidohydrolase family protein [Marinitoga aeolica]|uniref:Amidohydrolase family protein n=1 Tax=Marinitoga aeolica TaxID=2809031 RepID=A0ABY8PSD2_9BACT|nr:amidohydrolase family protein [Marinitoga aeolica]WGS65546.1 amidohydrolase family protein [Marinitoga aeolica]
MFDILIKNAKLRNYKELKDIGIKGGRIVEISDNISDKSEKIIEAHGNLVTESFVNPHLHLCKVYTLMKMNEEALKDYHGENMGRAMTAIELAAEIKKQYDEKWIIPNVRKALNLAVENGVTHIRAFADVDSKAKLVGVKSLLKVKEEFKDKLYLEVVAFPQDGIVKEPGTYELIKEAIKLGADVVGGIPWIELTEEDEKEHIDKMFEIAKEFNKPISMLVDDAGDPGLKTLEMLAVKTLKEGFEGKVLAHHARAMSMYSTPYLMKLIELLKKARIGIITDPHTGPLHARVKELISEGALVALGQDDISDAYYPYGRNNMLEVAFLASHILWMTTQKDMEILYDMITINGAKSMGIKDFEIKEGNLANLVILKEKNILESLRNHEKPQYVIFKGNIL